MFIQSFNNCQFNTPENIINIINAHINIPIKTINGSSLFDFIQNFASKYFNLKNKHGAFTWIIDQFNTFPYELIPLTKEELTDIEFTFKDNDTMKLNYTLYVPSKNVVHNKFLHFNKIENTLNNQKETNEIEWKYYTKDKTLFQCRVDNVNQVNVFKQSSLMSSNDLEEIVKKCFEEFYNNSFPIIGIESQNIWGQELPCSLIQQLTQVKILQRRHSAIKLTNLTEQYYPKNNIWDIETCKKIEKFEKIIDDYGNGTKHHRTQVFQELSPEKLKELEEIRKKYTKKI